jgi:hypothetical protein
MKTIEGYSKEKHTDTSVLLAGGGAKALSDFIGSLTWDSTNKKIKYTPVGGSATDLVTLSWDNISGKPSEYPAEAHDHYNLLVSNLTKETDITESGLRCYSGSGSTWTGTIPSMKYAAILSFGNPSRGWQIWAGRKGEVGNGLCWRRGVQAANGWDSVNLILDSANYTDYINTTNFAGLDKTGTVTSITLKAGTGISLDTDNTAITTSGTRTITNSGVRAVSINSNYLRVNTNGTDADLTIPYATSAGSATSASSVSYVVADSITTAGAGWYRVASYGSASDVSRSLVIFKIFSTGSSMTPRQQIIEVHFSWGRGAIYDCRITGIGPVSKVRTTYDDSKTYLEIYTSQLKASTYLYVNKDSCSNANGNEAYSWYTGALPAGGGTEVYVLTSNIKADYATTAGSVAWDNVTDHPTNLNQFTNGPGYITGQDHYKTTPGAGTAGTSTASSGSTLEVPYLNVNANGHITGYGTHTHTISGFLTPTSSNRQGVYKLYRRDDNSDYSIQHHWTGSYWYLRGYSGDTYHAGVQVAYANDAGNADTVDSYHASSLWRSDGGVWNPGANITLGATANDQEWSFDITRNGKTGCYWHVWDSSLSTMLKVNADDGKVSAPYGFVGNLSGNASSADYATSAGTADAISVYSSESITTSGEGWFRVAYYNSASDMARGLAAFSIITTGGSWSPYVQTIEFEGSWSHAYMPLCRIIGYGYVTKVRTTYDSTKVYIEVYTSSSISATRRVIADSVGYANINSAWNWYSGALPAGGGTQVNIFEPGNYGFATSSYIVAAGFVGNASSATYANSAGYVDYSLSWTNAAGTSQSYNGSSAITIDGIYEANRSTYVKDIGDSTAISFKYSSGGFTSNPSYLAAWNGYQITYVAPSYVTVGSATNATYIKTVQTETNANYYLTFVDSSNSSATSEQLYTSKSGLTCDPYYGSLNLSGTDSRPAQLFNCSGYNGKGTVAYFYNGKASSNSSSSTNGSAIYAYSLHGNGVYSYASDYFSTSEYVGFDFYGQHKSRFGTITLGYKADPTYESNYGDTGVIWASNKKAYLPSSSYVVNGMVCFVVNPHNQAVTFYASGCSMCYFRRDTVNSGTGSVSGEGWRGIYICIYAGNRWNICTTDMTN